MIRRLHLDLSLILLVLLFATAGHAAVDDLTEIVPTGSPVVYYVADVKASMDSWTKSPAAELWNDPQVQTFFAPLREDLEIDTWDEKVREETGYGLEEIWEMFTGDMVIYLEDFSLDLENPDAEPEMSMAMLADLGENASKFEELILQSEARAEAKTEDEAEDPDNETTREIREFRGVDLHIERVVSNGDVTTDFGWAMVDGVWAFGLPVDTLERTVGNILDGGVDEPLKANVNFETVSKHTRSADAWVYVDADAWMPLIRTTAELGLAAAEEEGSPFPLDPVALIDALGIEAMQALFFAVRSEDRIAAVDLGATYTEDRGLIKILAYGSGEAPRATFIPVDTDSFSTGRFNFSSAWSAFVDIMNGINPSLMGFAAMQLESTVQNSGVELNLQRDLLDNLTGEMVSLQNYEGITGESFADIQLHQDQVFALGIQQRAALENVIGSIKTIAGQGSEFFSQRDFDGHTIFTLDLPQAEGEAPGEQMAYAVADGYLLISVGSPATLEKVLLKMGTKGDSVWRQAQVRRAMNLLPEGANAVQYQDMAPVGDLIFSAIALLENMKPKDGEDNIRICDPGAVPDSGIVGRYFSSSVNGIWKNDRSFVIRAYSLPADKK